MKTKQFMIYHLLIYSFLFIPTMCNAQVTIGSINTPTQGALLQLKQSEGSVNATKGLGLPRVYLTDMNNIKVDISDISSGEEIIHTGLIVYNMNKCLFGGYGIGVYIWDGISWQYLGDRETSSPDVLIDQDQDGNNFRYRKFGDAGYWMIENLAAKKFAGSVTDIPFHTGVIDKTNPRIAYPNINPLDWTTPPVSRSANGMLYNSLAATNSYDPGVEQSQVAGAVPGPNEVENIGLLGTAPNKYVQGICPNGWHLPSDREWNALEKEIYENADKYSTYESADMSAWNPASPNPGWNTAWETTPTNTTRGSSTSGGHGIAMQSSCPPIGITADVPGKSYMVNKEGGFDSLPVGCVPDTKLPGYGRSAYYWSSSRSGNNAYDNWVRGLNFLTSIGILRYTPIEKGTLLSVRCKKND